MQLGDRLLQHPAPPQRLLAQVVGHGAGLADAVVPHQGPHGEQVHDADEAVLAPDRQLHHQRRGMQPPPDRLDGRVEVGSGPVQFVDERDARHAVPIGPPPDGLALRLDPGDAVEHRDGAVEHPQRTLHLVGEVDVAGGVDQVDPVPVPVAAHRGGEDGDAAVAFLGVEVGDGRAVVDLAALVGGAGEVEHPFGDGGLAGVHVGEDAEITDGGQRVEQVSTHGPCPFRDVVVRGRRDYPGERKVVRAAAGGGRAAGAGTAKTPGSPRNATGGRRRRCGHAWPAPFLVP